MLLNKFHEFSVQIRRAKKTDFGGKVLAFDPGETTGWCCLQRGQAGTELIGAGQSKTWPLPDGVNFVNKLLDTFEPNIVVYESYHIYSWKANQHKNSEVATIQVVGMIQTLAILRGLPRAAQTAQVGKMFCTDEKLENWGLWIPSLKHARDAIRHGCYYVLFGEPNTQVQGG
jgi:hypothetical protein